MTGLEGSGGVSGGRGRRSNERGGARARLRPAPSDARAFRPGRGATRQTRRVSSRNLSPIAFGSQTISRAAPRRLGRGKTHGFVPPPHGGFTFSCAIVGFPKNSAAVEAAASN